MKKVFAFVGSARKAHTYHAVGQFLSNLQSLGDVECELVPLSEYQIGICRGCKQCLNRGEEFCPLQDDRDALIGKMTSADGVVFASPVYSFQVSALTKVFLDRLGFVFHRPRFFSVWHFGRAVETYEGDKIVSTTGSWEAGVDGALPGIAMKPDPRVGDVYVGRYLNGEAKNMAEVLALDATVEVPHGAFTGALKTKEWSPLEPGVATERYYVKDLGLVLVEQVEGGTASEKLVSEFFP